MEKWVTQARLCAKMAFCRTNLPNSTEQLRHLQKIQHQTAKSQLKQKFKKILMQKSIATIFVDKVALQCYNTTRKETAGRLRGATHEESPSTTEQECRITSCGGDFKESATEIYRNACVVRVEMQGKSLQTCWWHHVHVNPTRCKKWDQMPARHLDTLAGGFR